MGRPSRKRRVCEDPGTMDFILENGSTHGERINITIDEYETIRLIDLNGISQEECARRMNVARTTAQAIYSSAKEKVAKSLVNGVPLHIEGGNIQVCHGDAGCPDCERKINDMEGVQIERF